MELRPVTRSKAAARAAYDRLSGWYDWLAGASEWGLVSAGLQRLAVQPGESVVEIGCGSGRALAQLAAAAGSKGCAVGLDLSPGMLRQALRRKPGASLACGDGVTLPFAAAAFDAIWLGFTLELFDSPEIPLALAECRRVLRPGGRIGVAGLSLAQGRPPAVRLYEWAHDAFPAVIDCRPILVAAALEAAGFCRVHGEVRLLFGLPVELAVARR